MHTSRLSDIARIDRASLSSEKIQDGTLYLGLENIESGGNIIKVQTVENGELKSSKFCFTPEHILYGKLRPYLAKITAPDFHGICSTDIIPVLPGPKVDRRYLLHFLRQDSMVEFATSRSSGANLPRLSPKELANFQIPLPPLAEQKRIAAILDAADELRAKRREAIAQLDVFLQSTFIEMFGDPVTNPMGWKQIELSSLVDASDRINYGVVQPGEEFPAGKPLIRVGDFVGGSIDFSGIKMIDPNIERKYQRSRLRGNELLISCVGSIGTICKVSSQAVGFNIARAVARVPLREEVSSDFMLYCLRSDVIQRYFLRETRTVSQPTLNISLIKAALVIQPPFDLQRRFATIVESVEQQKARMQAHLAELDALFVSLQHRAFNGEL
ncbi:restriction endonuclease subunit S [Vreelandella venusta]|uniref:restriction endonuclease subunit S n=1 Tax=Vreelandella venusta TaxID=44935 RepID=UPI00385070CE